MADGETFLLTFEPRPAVELDIVSFEGVPAHGTLQQTQLTEVTVNFNKPVAADGFPASAITLNCQGVPQDTEKINIERISDQTFRLHLNEVTLGNGYYVLTIQMANMRDADGFAGAVGRQATWVQFVDGKVNLRIAASPAEGGTVSPQTGKYDYDQPVTLTATPATGYDFLRWTESTVIDGSATDATNAVTLSDQASFAYTPQGDATITAVFQPRQYNVTINFDAKGGTVTGAGTGRYDYGTTFTLTATPAAGYQFDGWLVNGTAPDVSVLDGSPVETLTLTIEGETTIEAVFTLTPNITLTGRVTASNDDAPIVGTTVTLTAKSGGAGEAVYTAVTDNTGRYSLDIADRTLTYTVHCEADGYMWSATADIWFTEGSQQKNFVLMPGATVMLPESGICTFSSKVALDFTTATADAFYVKLYDKESFVVEPVTATVAGEGVLLKGTPGSRVDISEAASATALEDNMLTGTAYAPYVVGDDQVYVLADGESQFKRAAKGLTVDQGKAYVLYTIASEPATVSIIWGEATLIEMLRNSTDDGQNHYDLGGRRIYKTDKGVHIVNGQKKVK